MPFIEQKRRDLIHEYWGNLYWLHKSGEVITPDDLCYKFYKTLVDQWTVDPHWSNVHKLYKDKVLNLNTIFHSEDSITAAHLAWQVFFHFHVIPYVEKKRAENGDITGCPQASCGKEG